MMSARDLLNVVLAARFLGEDATIERAVECLPAAAAPVTDPCRDILRCRPKSFAIGAKQTLLSSYHAAGFTGTKNLRCNRRSG